VKCFELPYVILNCNLSILVKLIIFRADTHLSKLAFFCGGSVVHAGSEFESRATGMLHHAQLTLNIYLCMELHTVSSYKTIKSIYLLGKRWRVVKMVKFR
jgi:hypothetical protein